MNIANNGCDSRKRNGGTLAMAPLLLEINSQMGAAEYTREYIVGNGTYTQRSAMTSPAMDPIRHPHAWIM